MKITKTLILFFALSWSSLCFGQEYFNNVIELSFEAGLINDLKSDKSYLDRFDQSKVINFENRNFARASNFGFSYSTYIKPKFGIKLLYSRTTFGFDYSIIEQGSTATNPESFGSVRTTHAELGIALIWKTPLTPFINLLLEPSIRLHTEHEVNSNSIIIYTTDSFSLTNFAGIEFPIFSDNFFINTGVQIKIPLKSYSFMGWDEYPGYYPYFIGIRIGVNYHF